ncbi:hypothetical protein [Priestia megaterium]|uniref:hypothetical protein n=1 Tax=Priestia megaterium TaxID=1404 RepID=UPI000BEE6C30|nr:hypothetical protein [Priestia megaterium]PED64021.1 hypothetical protein CON20_23955 [Priestia megaterium]
MKILKFKQDNCTPCKMLETFLKNDLRVDADVTHNISSGEPKDLAKALDAAEKYEIMSTPALALVDDEGNLLKPVVFGVGRTKVTEIFKERGLI